MIFPLISLTFQHHFSRKNLFDHLLQQNFIIIPAAVQPKLFPFIQCKKRNWPDMIFLPTAVISAISRSLKLFVDETRVIFSQEANN